MCLGAKLCKIRLHNEVLVWVMSPVKYVQEVVKNCTVHLVANYGGRFRLLKMAENPFKTGYPGWIPVQSYSQTQHLITKL